MSYRCLESRMKFAACAQPTDSIGSFQHYDALAALRQIRRTHESIVPCTNNNCVVVVRFQNLKSL